MAGQGDPLSVRLASAMFTPVLFLFLKVCIQTCKYIHVYSIHVYVYNYIYIGLSVYLSICLSVYLSIYLSVYLSIYLYIYISICIYIYLVEKEQTQQDKIYLGLKTHHSPRDQGLLLRCCTDRGNPSLAGIHCRPDLEG